MSFIADIMKNRQLMLSLIKREIVGRYRGSMMGLLWSFLNPVFMLLVYTFVFSVVFKARWPGGGGSRTEFALILFAGLIVFNLFSECFVRAPSLVINNVNYVKKVVFPLQILPCVAMGSALFHLIISLIVWMIFYIIFYGNPHLSALLFPVMLAPLVLTTLGLSWFLASLGVYLRDVAQIVGILSTVLMFLSPIFYSVEMLPPLYQKLVHLSPLTLTVEQARQVLFWGTDISWTAWSIYSLTSIAIAISGYTWFQKTREGFADVL